MSRIVRYEDESGSRFDFQLQDCLNYLARDSRRMQVAIAFQAQFLTPSEEPLVLRWESHERAVVMAADLLEECCGVAYCPDCDRSFSATATVLERYIRGRRHLPEGGRGRRFFCQRGHCLLTTVD